MSREYTWGERLKLARLEGQMARQVAAAGDENAASRRLERQAERIYEKAEERYERGAAIALGALDQAENELARAEHALRSAKGPDKAAARRARNDAKDKVRRADRAARRYR